jgi:DNA polymerase-3 subunit epsilon
LQTLQQRLRQVRAWQHLTLGAVAGLVSLPTKDLVAVESGDVKYLRPTEGRMKLLANAYNLTPMMLERLFDEEYAWRVSAVDGNPKTLPRIAQYLYRPLPAVARQIFADKDFVVLDMETTGVSPHDLTTEVLEVAIVGSDGSTLLNTLVKPVATTIPNTHIHGITTEMCASAPSFREVYPEIVRAIQNKIVVVYNADYDAYLLDKEIIRHDFDMPQFDQWCLMLAYAEYFAEEGRFGGFAWQKLMNACSQQEIILGDAHRALGDAVATYALLGKLAQPPMDSTEKRARELGYEVVVDDDMGTF